MADRHFVLVLAGGLWIACSSSTTGEGAATETKADLPWGRDCTLDLAAEPVLQDGYQRCTEVWSKEKNAGKPCLLASECEAAGGVCTPRNGGLWWNTLCHAACNPAACPDEAGSCVSCEGQTPHCENEPRRCYPPSQAPVNGRGELCSASETTSSCEDTADCCSNQYGRKSTCYQLMTNGKPNTLSESSCKMNCATDRDCDDVFGDTSGYCCLTVLPDSTSTTLGYTPVGKANGDKTCVTKKFDPRCLRVPAPSGGSGSSGSSGGCDYAGCMKACTEAGGTNCGEDCKC